MKLSVLGAAALAATCAWCVPASAKSPVASTLPVRDCDVHVYPAEALHSVGEDFDAVHRVDQDLRHYYEAAGRPLDWLNTARQLEILAAMQLGAAAGVTETGKTLHPEPLGRRQALEGGPRVQSPGCVLEILLPQIMLERGGLATRSLRVFGVVRRFEAGEQVQSYAGYAAGPMAGFQMRSPADVPASTAIVETAYREAVETVLRNATKPKRH